MRRGDFQGGADTTGEIRFASVRPQRKQKRRILFTFGMSCPRDHRKRQSERSPAGAVSWNSVTKPLQSNSKRIRLNI